MFHPLDDSGARVHRRLVFATLPIVTAFTRFVWRHSRCSRSLDPESTRLWRWIWSINRYLFCLPRTRSYDVQLQMTRNVRTGLDIARLTDALTLSFGIGESGIGHLCSMLCRPDSIVLDVGANIGSTTLAFAEIVSRGQVHAFEPAADMRSVLLSNIQSSHFANVTVYPFGLAEGYRTGHLQIAMQGNPGSAYFVPDQIAEVELRSLDEVLLSVHPVDFINIDVEGYEKYVLMGGQQLLCRDKPAIVFEVSEPSLERAGTCSQAIFDLLEKWGYTLWGLRESQFYEYVPEMHRTSSVHNVLALHPGNARTWQILHDKQL